MTKKIIIVGPPGAGKTTLSKIFFEGENSSKILEYGLEPTRGQDSVLLNLSEKIGIFDLGGQENQRWFETDEKKIFHDAKIIIIVFEINSYIENIINFLERLIVIRNQLSPFSMIFVLMHKIDLVYEEKIIEISKIIYKNIRNVKLIKVFFTSVKSNYIAQTFSYFIDIIKTCIIDIEDLDKSSYYLLEEILKLIYILYKKEFISKKDIQNKLNRSEKLVDKILNYLIDKGHIQFSGLHEEDKLFFLTYEGKLHFNKLLEYFTLESLIKREKVETFYYPISGEKIPSFIGSLIMNKNGKFLFKFETNQNLINKILLTSFFEDKPSRYSDTELNSSFNDALEIFIQQINIRDLSGLKLKACNLHFIEFNELILILFINPEINFKEFEPLIKEYLLKFYKENKLSFDILKTGSNINNPQLIQIGKEWLENLNNCYDKMLKELLFFDVKYSKMLYSKLDELANNITYRDYKVHEKIKKLKVELMNNVLEENLENIKKNAKEIYGLCLKFQI